MAKNTTAKRVSTKKGEVQKVVNEVVQGDATIFIGETKVRTQVEFVMLFGANFDTVLRDTLNRVHYVLDMEALKASDPTFKGFLNRWKLMDDRKARTDKLRGSKINSDKLIVKKNQKV